jgi:S1-C subfamily serine protease
VTTGQAAGDPETREPRSRGKLVALLGLVLALLVLAATAWFFRTEISRFCLRTYWRLRQLPGAVGIAVVQEFQPSSSAIQVTEVLRRSDDAVLRPGDFIIQVSGEDVKTIDDLARSVRGRSAGEVLPFVVRRGGETLELEVMLEPRE